jgi:hypothetical protein
MSHRFPWPSLGLKIMMINVINQWIFVGYHIFKQTQILSSSIDVSTGTRKNSKGVKTVCISSFSFGLKCSEQIQKALKNTDGNFS